MSVPAMLTVGVFARAEPAQSESLKRMLQPPTCLEVLDLEEEGTLGLVVQASDADAAHAWLQDESRKMPGVLCAWPVHSELAP